MADSQKYGRTANLFNADTVVVTRLYGSSAVGHPIYENPTDAVQSLIIPCEPNTTYTVQKIISNRYLIWTTTTIPATSNSWNNQFSGDATQTTLTFTTGNSDNYLLFMLSYDSTTPSTQDIINSIMLNYGTTPLPYQPYYGWLHSLRKLTTATEAVENPLYSDGTAITSYTIKGNTVQSGTPTPSNPVDVVGVGERTENLFDVENATETDKYVKNDGTIETGANGDKFLLQTIQCQPDTQYTFSWESIVLGSDHNTPYIRVAEYDSNNNFILRNLINCLDNDLYKRRTITTSSQTVKLDIRYDYNCSRGQIVNGVMLNIGNIALPYEPYGYKIPISSGGVTTNIYLGSTQTVRQIKKLVLDGTEDITHYTIATGELFRIAISPSRIALDVGLYGYCTHYKGVANTEPRVSGTFSGSGALPTAIDIVDDTYTTSDTFKAYLQQQYANGTPVTIWYVLATPETAAVNEPLMKIGNYADTLSNAVSIPTTEGANSITVDTTVQPSEFTATWTGWHNASVKEYDGSDWN